MYHRRTARRLFIRTFTPCLVTPEFVRGEHAPKLAQYQHLVVPRLSTSTHRSSTPREVHLLSAKAYLNDRLPALYPRRRHLEAFNEVTPLIRDRIRSHLDGPACSWPIQHITRSSHPGRRPG